MKNLLLYLFNIISLSVTAQTIEVTIKDAVTMEYLPYAGVRFLHSNHGFYTDEKGNGIINNKIDNNDTISISYVGYHEKIVPVGFSNDGVSFHFDIHLVYWEDIAKEPSLGNYVSSTLTYNKDEDEKSQILNNQKRKL